MTDSRHAWFHCFAGIAGDMALGSLLDAGASIEEVARTLGTLGVPGITLTSERVLRAGLRSTRALIQVTEDRTTRTFSDISQILESAPLEARIRDRSLSVFTALAEAEGAIHGVEPAEVHFHEVGGHDAIADVVGTATALELLDIETVSSGPVAMGTGTITSAHGMLPNPPPAVLALLRGAPIYGREVTLELTTPTGAALLAALCSNFGPMPSMRIESTGYGAGGREIDGFPNVTQVVLGTTTDAPNHRGDPGGQPLVLLEANLDDATGEQLADALAALLQAGALDAWITPVVMKKGRPGHVLAALAEVPAATALRTVLLHESGSFGAREHLVDRYAVSRELTTVVVQDEPIQLKIGAGRAKVEHDDARRAAAKLGLSVSEVVSLAEEAYRASS